MKKEVHITGRTMATNYNIKIVVPLFASTEGLNEKIESRLNAINQSMSTFIKESEISIFNSEKKCEKKYVSDDFFNVIISAKEVYELTKGAWDGTINPFMKIWRFHDLKNIKKIPEKELIAQTLMQVGFDKIEISKEKYLRKKNPAITIDLASIAKGYAVDAVSSLIIKETKSNDFLVEIGGEVFASGFRKDGKKWRVGINTPDNNASYDSVYKIVTLHDMAMATSGNYRNFFELDGKKYTHIIDPKTGYPIDNGVVSVSVIAKNCTLADGLATGIMVLGYEKGIALVNGLKDIECLIVVKNKENKFIDYYSKGFVQN
ncbi:MAG: FAD:protein FMN transferase [Desulfobacterales bacterium]|nr:FAD:protein FMN transferase [Desulfobacterales bacterium]